MELPCRHRAPRRDIPRSLLISACAIVRVVTRRAVHLIATALALVLSAQVATVTVCEVVCLLGIPDSSASDVADNAADCHATDTRDAGVRVDGNATGCEHAASLNPAPAQRIRSGIEMPAPAIEIAGATSVAVSLRGHSFPEFPTAPPGSPRGLSLPLRL